MNQEIGALDSDFRRVPITSDLKSELILELGLRTGPGPGLDKEEEYQDKRRKEGKEERAKKKKAKG